MSLSAGAKTAGTKQDVEPDRHVTAEIAKRNPLHAYAVGDHDGRYAAQVLHVLQTTGSMKMVKDPYRTVANTLSSIGNYDQESHLDKTQVGREPTGGITIDDFIGASTPATKSVRFSDRRSEPTSTPTSTLASSSEEPNSTTQAEATLSSPTTPKSISLEDEGKTGPSDLPIEAQELPKFGGFASAAPPGTPGPNVARPTDVSQISTEYGYANDTVANTLAAGILSHYPDFFEIKNQKIESDGWRQRRLALYEYFADGMAKHEYLIKGLPHGDIRGLIEIVLKHGKRGRAELKIKSKRNFLNLRKNSSFAQFLALFDACVADLQIYCGKMDDDDLVTHFRLCLEQAPRYMEEIRLLTRDRDLDYLTLRSELTIFAIATGDIDSQSSRTHFRAQDSNSRPGGPGARNRSQGRDRMQDKHRLPAYQRRDGYHVNAVDTDDFICNEEDICYMWKRNGSCTREACPFQHPVSRRGDTSRSSSRSSPGQSGNRASRGRGGDRSRGPSSSGRGSSRGGGAPRPTQGPSSGTAICFRYEDEGKCDRPNCRFAHINASGARVNSARARSDQYQVDVYADDEHKY
jgi:hypothetical protein